MGHRPWASRGARLGDTLGVRLNMTGRGLSALEKRRDETATPALVNEAPRQALS